MPPPLPPTQGQRESPDETPREWARLGLDRELAGLSRVYEAAPVANSELPVTTPRLSRRSRRAVGAVIMATMTVGSAGSAFALRDTLFPAVHDDATSSVWTSRAGVAPPATVAETTTTSSAVPTTERVEQVPATDAPEPVADSTVPVPTDVEDEDEGPDSSERSNDAPSTEPPPHSHAEPTNVRPAVEAPRAATTTTSTTTTSTTTTTTTTTTTIAPRPPKVVAPVVTVPNVQPSTTTATTQPSTTTAPTTQPAPTTTTPPKPPKPTPLPIPPPTTVDRDAIGR